MVEVRLELSLDNRRVVSACPHCWGVRSRLALLSILQVTRLAAPSADGALQLTFATLSRDSRCERLFDALGGTLRAAKQHGYVNYRGDLLLEGTCAMSPVMRILWALDSNGIKCPSVLYLTAFPGRDDMVEITVLRPAAGVQPQRAAVRPTPPPKPSAAAAAAARPDASATPAALAGEAAAPSARAAPSSSASEAVQIVQRIFNGDPSIDWYGILNKFMHQSPPAFDDRDHGSVRYAAMGAGRCSSTRRTCACTALAKATRPALKTSSAMATSSMATCGRPLGACRGGIKRSGSRTY